MNDRSAYDVLANIRGLTVELNNTPPLNHFEVGPLEGNKKYLILIEEILKQIKADGSPGWAVRKYIEELWGYDLDDALNAYERCSDPED